MTTIKVKNKKSSKSSKHKKKRTEKSLLVEDDDSDDLTLNKELHSIGHYVNDRQEMIEQIFSTMTEEKLRSMLPPVLRDESIKSLKSDCLEALLGMSSKRIKSILSGEDLGSQSSETESEESQESSSADEIKQEVMDIPSESVKPSEGENLLEIVELQLRARAIRAALEHHCISPEPPARKEDAPHTSKSDDSTVKDSASDEVIVIDSNDKLDEIVVIPDSPDADDVDENAFEKLASKTTEKDSAATVIVTNKPFGKSKKNVVLIGPKRKVKSKVISSKQNQLLATDNNGNCSETNNVFTRVESSETTVMDTVTSAQDAVIPLVEDLVTDDVQRADNAREETYDQSQSWVQRWLHVQETDSAVKTQKKTSKIITTVKQKLREESKKIDGARTDDHKTADEDPAASEVFGTVCEYQLLPQSSLAKTLADPPVVNNDTTADEAEAADVVEEADEAIVVEEAGEADVVEEVDEANMVEEPEEDVVEVANVQTATEAVETATDVVNTDINVDNTAAVDDDPLCTDELELHYEDIDDILPQDTKSGPMKY